MRTITLLFFFVLGCGGPAPLMRLTALFAAGGTVSGDGLTCSAASCSGEYAKGTTVVVHPVPAAGYVFDQWTRDCTGTGDCTLLMDADHHVTASFAPTATLTLVVRSDGGGSGSVTSDPPGISCASAPCTATIEVKQGTPVTLTPAPAAGSGFHWKICTSSQSDCAICAPNQQTCTVPLSRSATATGIFSAANYVFVSSASFASDALTVPGADSACNTLAAGRSLPGSYVAWLSTQDGDAISRIPATARGWIRTDGLPFADTLADLTEKDRVYYPVLLDESGLRAGPAVHTGSTRSGRRNTGKDCSGFSSSTGDESVGVTAGGPGAWTDMGGECGTYPVYCFGTSFSTPVTPAKAPGRIAFVSKTQFGMGAGIAGADAICNQEAADAGLPGSYRALLAGTSASAASRFDTTGPTWVRPDGIPVLGAAGDLPGLRELLAPIAVTADGSYLVAPFAWSGNSALGQPGSADSTCQDWSSTTTLVHGGTIGSVDEASLRAFSVAPLSCVGKALLYCLQQ